MKINGWCDKQTAEWREERRNEERCRCRNCINTFMWPFLMLEVNLLFFPCSICLISKQRQKSKMMGAQWCFKTQEVDSDLWCTDLPAEPQPHHIRLFPNEIINLIFSSFFHILTADGSDCMMSGQKKVILLEENYRPAIQASANQAICSLHPCLSKLIKHVGKTLKKVKSIKCSSW